MTYTMGGADRALGMADNGNSITYVTGATYAPQGGIAGFTNQDTGITARFSYNSRLQPLQMFYGTNAVPSLTGTTCPANPGNLLHHVYHFSAAAINDNGNVLGIDNCRDTTRSQNFTYDSLNRITSAYTTGMSGGSPDYSWGNTYTVDAWGNLTNMSQYDVHHTAYQNLQASPANWKNQLNITGQTYDAAGNLTNDGNGNAYTYDIENLLSTAAGWTYGYDGDGRRVRKCNSCSTSAGGTLYWYGEDASPLIESDLNGSLLYEYMFFNGKRIARRHATSNTIIFYFSDHLGSTAVTVGTGGARKDEYDFAPYGYQIVTVADTVPQNFKFNGKEHDSESGLDEFGARYYSSATGRFIQTDWAAKPLSVPYANFGNPQSLNLYSFVQNNPATFGDPDGHSA